MIGSENIWLLYGKRIYCSTNVTKNLNVIIYNFRDIKLGTNMENLGNENEGGVILEPSIDLHVDVSMKEVSFKPIYTHNYFLRIRHGITHNNLVILELLCLH